MNDDDLDFAPNKGTSSNLDALFGTTMTPPKGNVSLMYTPPKAPRKENAEDALNKRIGPVNRNLSGGKLKLIITKGIQAYKLENGSYVNQGTAGIAVIGNHELHAYQIIIYKGNKEHLSKTHISSNFSFVVLENNYASFYDDLGQNWSVMFSISSDVEHFAKQVLIAKCNSMNEVLNYLLIQDLSPSQKLKAGVGDCVVLKYDCSLLNNDEVTPFKETTDLHVNIEECNLIPWYDGLKGCSEDCRRAIIVPFNLSAPWTSEITQNSMLLITLHVECIISSDTNDCVELEKDEKLISDMEDRSPAAENGANPSGSEEEKSQTKLKPHPVSVADSIFLSRSHKMNLISRIAKVGHAALPLPRAYICGPCESERESHGKYSPRVYPVNETNGQFNSGPDDTKPMVQYSQAPPPMSNNTEVGRYEVGLTLQQPQAKTGINITCHQVIPYRTEPPSTLPSESRLVSYLSESKAQVTDLQSSVNKISDKVEFMLLKLDNMRVDNSDKPNQTSSGMDPLKILESIRNIISENENLQKSLREKEQREKEQREKEQREKEQREKEQREKEQREKEQREKEEREKEQREKEQKEKDQWKRDGRDDDDHGMQSMGAEGSSKSKEKPPPRKGPEKQSDKWFDRQPGKRSEMELDRMSERPSDAHSDTHLDKHGPSKSKHERQLELSLSETMAKNEELKVELAHNKGKIEELEGTIKMLKEVVANLSSPERSDHTPALQGAKMLREAIDEKNQVIKMLEQEHRSTSVHMKDQSSSAYADEESAVSSGDVKTLMNNAFKRMRGQIDDNGLYTGSEVMRSVSAALRGVGMDHLKTRTKENSLSKVSLGTEPVGPLRGPSRMQMRRDESEVDPWRGERRFSDGTSRWSPWRNEYEAVLPESVSRISAMSDNRAKRPEVSAGRRDRRMSPTVGPRMAWKDTEEEIKRGKKKRGRSKEDDYEGSESDMELEEERRRGQGGVDHREFQPPRWRVEGASRPDEDKEVVTKGSRTRRKKSSVDEADSKRMIVVPSEKLSGKHEEMGAWEEDERGRVKRVESRKKSEASEMEIAKDKHRMDRGRRGGSIDSVGKRSKDKSEEALMPATQKSKVEVDEKPRRASWGQKLGKRESRGSMDSRSKGEIEEKRKWPSWFQTAEKKHSKESSIDVDQRSEEEFDRKHKRKSRSHDAEKKHSKESSIDVEQRSEEEFDRKHKRKSRSHDAEKKHSKESSIDVEQRSEEEFDRKHKRKSRSHDAEKKESKMSSMHVDARSREEMDEKRKRPSLTQRESSMAKGSSTDTDQRSEEEFVGKHKRPSSSHGTKKKESKMSATQMDAWSEEELEEKHKGPSVTHGTEKKDSRLSALFRGFSTHPDERGSEDFDGKHKRPSSANDADRRESKVTTVSRGSSTYLDRKSRDESDERAKRPIWTPVRRSRDEIAEEQTGPSLAHDMEKRDSRVYSVSRGSSMQLDAKSRDDFGEKHKRPSSANDADRRESKVTTVSRGSSTYLDRKSRDESDERAKRPIWTPVRRSRDEIAEELTGPSLTHDMEKRESRVSATSAGPSPNLGAREDFDEKHKGLAQDSERRESRVSTASRGSSVYMDTSSREDLGEKHKRWSVAQDSERRESRGSSVQLGARHREDSDDKPKRPSSANDADRRESKMSRGSATHMDRRGRDESEDKTKRPIWTPDVEKRASRMSTGSKGSLMFVDASSKELIDEKHKRPEARDSRRSTTSRGSSTHVDRRSRDEGEEKAKRPSLHDADEKELRGSHAHVGKPTGSVEKMDRLPKESLADVHKMSETEKRVSRGEVVPWKGRREPSDNEEEAEQPEVKEKGSWLKSVLSATFDRRKQSDKSADGAEDDRKDSVADSERNEDEPEVKEKASWLKGLLKVSSKSQIKVEDDAMGKSESVETAQEGLAKKEAETPRRSRGSSVRIDADSLKKESRSSMTEDKKAEVKERLSWMSSLLGLKSRSKIRKSGEKDEDDDSSDSTVLSTDRDPSKNGDKGGKDDGGSKTQQHTERVGWLRVILRESSKVLHKGADKKRESMDESLKAPDEAEKRVSAVLGPSALHRSQSEVSETEWIDIKPEMRDFFAVMHGIQPEPRPPHYRNTESLSRIRSRNVAQVENSPHSVSLHELPTQDGEAKREVVKERLNRAKSLSSDLRTEGGGLSPTYNTNEKRSKSENNLFGESSASSSELIKPDNPDKQGNPSTSPEGSNPARANVPHTPNNPNNLNRYRKPPLNDTRNPRSGGGPDDPSRLNNPSDANDTPKAGTSGNDDKTGGRGHENNTNSGGANNSGAAGTSGNANPASSSNNPNDPNDPNNFDDSDGPDGHKHPKVKGDKHKNPEEAEEEKKPEKKPHGLFHTSIPRHSEPDGEEKKKSHGLHLLDSHHSEAGKTRVGFQHHDQDDKKKPGPPAGPSKGRTDGTDSPEDRIAVKDKFQVMHGIRPESVSRFDLRTLDSSLHIPVVKPKPPPKAAEPEPVDELDPDYKPDVKDRLAAMHGVRSELFKSRPDIADLDGEGFIPELKKDKLATIQSKSRQQMNMQEESPKKESHPPRESMSHHHGRESSSHHHSRESSGHHHSRESTSHHHGHEAQGGHHKPFLSFHHAPTIGRKHGEDEEAKPSGSEMGRFHGKASKSTETWFKGRLKKDKSHKDLDEAGAHEPLGSTSKGNVKKEKSKLGVKKDRSKKIRAAETDNSKSWLDMFDLDTESEQETPSNTVDKMAQVSSNSLVRHFPDADPILGSVAMLRRIGNDDDEFRSKSTISVSKPQDNWSTESSRTSIQAGPRLNEDQEKERRGAAGSSNDRTESDSRGGKRSMVKKASGKGAGTSGMMKYSPKPTPDDDDSDND